MGKFSLGMKTPQNGYRVSHSHRRTKHQWLPNFQNKRLYSVMLDRFIATTVTVHELRTVDRIGGLDEYLLSVGPDALSPDMRRIQDLIQDRHNNTPAVA